MNQQVGSRIQHEAILTRFPFAAFSLLALAFLTGCGSSETIVSTWTDRPVSLENPPPGWKASLSPLKDGQASLTAWNDDQFLYFCLTSSDERFQRQFIAGGFTASFDTPAGTVGVHFPLGFGREGVPSPARSAEMGEDPGAAQDFDAGALRDLEITGPGKSDVMMFSRLQIPDSILFLRHERGRLLYQLKIPLHTPGIMRIALGAGPGSDIRFRLQTGSLQRSAPEHRPPGEGMGGDGGSGRDRMGDGARHGGGRRGGNEGRSQRPASPMDVKAVLHLASGETMGNGR